VKAIILAGCGALAYLALATVLFRVTVPRSRATAMLGLFAATVPLLIAAHILTTPDLGVLPPALTNPSAPVDFAFTLFLYLTAFLGGSLQLYNLAERGFSLTIMMDVVRAGERGMTLDDVRRGYSRGHGIGWMFEKRIRDMQAGDAIALEGDDVVLRPRGARVAALAGAVRDFLHLNDRV
jgi:hypothetical protein